MNDKWDLDTLLRQRHVSWLQQTIENALQEGRWQEEDDTPTDGTEEDEE